MKPFLRFFIPFLAAFQVLSSASGQSNYADCSNAFILCDKSPLNFQELSSYGNLLEPSPGSCFRTGALETNSVWLKWQAATSGTLTFSILPNDENNDIDFVLCRTNSLNDFSNYEVLRCMAAGPTLGNESSKLQNCMGATGLRESALTTNQSSGCPNDIENFLSSIDMKAGDYYTLYINNFRSTGGIMIEWGGTGTFQQIPGQCIPNSSATSDPPSTLADDIAFSLPFPNPVSNTVSIQINTTQQHSGSVQIINSDGKVAAERNFNFQIGNNILTLPTKDLRPGIYYLLFRFPSGNKAIQFIKQ